MSNLHPIEAIFWDMGGVIVRTEDSSRRRSWEERLGLSPGALAALVFEGEMGRRAAVGQAQIEENWTWVLQQLKLPDSERTQLIEDFWAGDRVDYDLVARIREFGDTYHVGMITNAFPDVRRWLVDEWGIADAFEEIIVSAELGVVKPDPAIYHHALERLAVRAERSVFIDDFEENVAGAQAVGMHAIHFQSVQQALADLDQLLAEG